MILRMALALLVAAAVVSCGIKSDLELPSGAQADKKRPDPSLPPQPLGK
jgi:predicted small lipoprotein YifL